MTKPWAAPTGGHDSRGGDARAAGLTAAGCTRSWRSYGHRRRIHGLVRPLHCPCGRQARRNRLRHHRSRPNFAEHRPHRRPADALSTDPRCTASSLQTPLPAGVDFAALADRDRSRQGRRRREPREPRPARGRAAGVRAGHRAGRDGAAGPPRDRPAGRQRGRWWAARPSSARRSPTCSSSATPPSPCATRRTRDLARAPAARRRAGRRRRQCPA